MRRLGFTCALAVLLASERAAASPEDLFGYGTRTGGMGATGVAHAQGAETAWHNPALASTIRDSGLTLGFQGAVFGLAAPKRISAEPAKGLLIGAAVPLPLGGGLRDRLGLALAFYTPTDVVVRGRVLYPERPQFPLLPDRAQSVTLRAAAGVDLGYGFRAGAGVAVLAELVGNVVAATDATGRVGTSVEQQLIATYAPVAGVTWDVPKLVDSKLRLGLTVRGTLDARFAVIVDGSKLSSIPIPPFNISGVAQYDPAQAAFEIARVDRLNVIALQGVYKRWSDFPGVLEPTVVCRDGGVGACGLLPPRIDWQDTFAVRLGAEQGFELAPGVVLRGRGGAFLETSALPGKLPAGEAFAGPEAGVGLVPTRYYDAARLAVTSGVGLAAGPVDVDLFVQYHLLLARNVVSEDPLGARLSDAAASGQVKVFGISGAVKF